MNASFIANVERILWLYGLPLDPAFLVVCFDECHCFLAGDTIDPIAIQTEKVAKENCASL